MNVSIKTHTPSRLTVLKFYIKTSVRRIKTVERKVVPGVSRELNLSPNFN